MVNRRRATEAEAAALASAVRLRIIRLTHQRPSTNKELAQRLGKHPATTLHHVRKLVATGFLEALPSRVGNRGAKEIPYRSTGLSWKLDCGEVERPLDTQEAMLQAYLGEVADTGLGSLVQARLIVQLDEAGLEELKHRFYSLLEELAARPVDPEGDRMAIYLAFYPGD